MSSIIHNFRTNISLERPNKRYMAQRRDLFPIPSPFWGDLNRMKAGPYGTIEATRIQGFRSRTGIFDPDRDRRLPITRVIGDSGLDDSPRKLVYESNELYGWDDVQYLGEHMVCGDSQLLACLCNMF